MAAPCFIETEGRRTWLKWHRGRRTISDPVFTGRRILEGMRLGASVEVDLVIHADRGLAVLHDLLLDHDTTGTGRVVDTPADALRQLHLRGNDGEQLPDRVMLFEDLCALLTEGELQPDALLQLDFKETSSALDERAIETFKRTVAPVAKHMILSAGDAAAVAMLTAGVEGLRIGYDPCHDDALAALTKGRDYRGFVADAVAASPRAEMIYLDKEVVMAADVDGFPIIEAFHRAARRIDVYTLAVSDAAAVTLARRFVALGADQITTDDPEGLGIAIEAHLKGF